LQTDRLRDIIATRMGGTAGLDGIKSPISYQRALDRWLAIDVAWELVRRRRRNVDCPSSFRPRLRRTLRWPLPGPSVTQVTSSV